MGSSLNRRLPPQTQAWGHPDPGMKREVAVQLHLEIKSKLKQGRPTFWVVWILLSQQDKIILVLAKPLETRIKLGSSRHAYFPQQPLVVKLRGRIVDPRE